MHRMGGVSRSVKFSLAGNSEAIAAATEREGALSLLPAATRKFWSGGKPRLGLDLKSSHFRSGKHSPLTAQQELVANWSPAPWPEVESPPSVSGGRRPRNGRLEPGEWGGGPAILASSQLQSHRCLCQSVSWQLERPVHHSHLLSLPRPKSSHSS